MTYYWPVNSSNSCLPYLKVEPALLHLQINIHQIAFPQRILNNLPFILKLFNDKANSN